jgi:hypothetical protein
LRWSLSIAIDRSVCMPVTAGPNSVAKNSIPKALMPKSLRLGRMDPLVSPAVQAVPGTTSENIGRSCFRR